MTEREKMLAGQLYDCGDPELLTQWHKAKDLVRSYNSLPSEDAAQKDRILGELLGGKGKNLWITAPFFADYGNNIYFGNNVVIGAGSVVTKDIPDNSVAYGNPCRVMRKNN